jgi:hypothetical protein
MCTTLSGTIMGQIAELCKELKGRKEGATLTHRTVITTPPRYMAKEDRGNECKMFH